MDYSWLAWRPHLRGKVEAYTNAKRFLCLMVKHRSYDAIILSGWHLFLPFRLISRKHWYMLLTYQKAEIINTRFWLIPVCSVLLFCRQLCTELPGYMKQNKCGDFIMSRQQEPSAKELSPASFCPPSWMRFGDAASDPRHLADLLQGCFANQRRSPAERARHFHTGFLCTKRKGK